MRRELTWGLAATAALAVGLAGARWYAELTAPYYFRVASLIAMMHPWRIDSISVADNSRTRGAQLILHGFVFSAGDNEHPAAMINSRLQVGAAVETPVVFWTILLLWPAATWPNRLARLMLAIPVFLALEALTTAIQLVAPLADVPAMLAGERDPLTAWDLWTRFLEAGGGFVVDIAAALLVVFLLAGNNAAKQLRNTRFGVDG